MPMDGVMRVSRLPMEENTCPVPGRSIADEERGRPSPTAVISGTSLPCPTLGSPAA